MQLAKNLFLLRNKTLSRKFEELILTSYLERKISPANRRSSSFISTSSSSVPTFTGLLRRPITIPGGARRSSTSRRLCSCRPFFPGRLGTTASTNAGHSPSRGTRTFTRSWRQRSSRQDLRPSSTKGSVKPSSSTIGRAPSAPRPPSVGARFLERIDVRYFLPRARRAAKK